MSILFLKTPSTGSFVRPSGYTFPTGLNIITAAGPTSVDYLVVAGGGGGYIGAAGAGGFRTATGFGIVNGTTYGVTVGGGGTPAGNGNDSIFSSRSE
jgi:hypothetical protein